MRILYDRLGINVMLELSCMYSFAIESEIECMRFTQELWNEYNGEEGHIIISDSGKKINISKDVAVIVNPFAVSLNDKKIVNQLYKDLLKIVLEELPEQKNNLAKELINCFDKVVTKTPYPITYDFDVDDIGLFKLYHVGFDDKSTSFIDKLVDYMKLCSSICGIRLFFFINLKSFISEQEYEMLYETIKYEEITIVNLSNRPDYIMNKEKCFLIDRDLCIIEMN